MQSFVGEAGAAQAAAEGLFAQCPILRNGDPGLVLAPPRHRFDFGLEPSGSGQFGPRPIWVALKGECPGEPHTDIPIARPLRAHPLEQLYRLIVVAEEKMAPPEPVMHRREERI